MVERALLAVLIALGLVFSASLVATSFNKLAERLGCAFEQAKVCVIDGEAE